MEAPPVLAQHLSPEVDDSGRVTVRLNAPEAGSVVVRGLGDEAIALSRAEEADVWEVTTPPLAPEIYEYTFEVDGTIMIDPQNRRVKKWITLASMVEVPGDPPALHAWRPVPHGALTRHRYASSTTGGERGVLIYTPPGYLEARGATYPVVYLLHGFGDDEGAWQENGRAHVILDNLLAEARCRPMIVVMPYGHPVPIPREVDFETYAPENLRAMERDLFDDLMPYIGSRYRVSPDREERAIVGLSMGGGQALTIGLRHLETFAWVGGFSSAAPSGNLAERFPRLVEDVDEVNARLRKLWIGCGEDDFLLEYNHAFVEGLKEHGIVHTYSETGGGHTWSVWRRYWATFAELLFGGPARP